jgi:hypothetical protein
LTDLLPVTFTIIFHTNPENRMVLSRQSKAKWRSTAIANFTPKELGAAYAA